MLKYELPPKPSDDALKLDNQQEEEMTSGQAMAQLIQEAIREFNPKLLEYKKAENEDENWKEIFDFKFAQDLDLIMLDAFVVFLIWLLHFSQD